jgi:hypothetical protein
MNSAERRLPSGCRVAALTQISAGDLDIAVRAQLATAHLPFGHQFEPRPIHVIGFEAALRGWGLVEQELENPPRHPNHALILADTDAELDGTLISVPSGIWRKPEEHRDLLGARRYHVLGLFSSANAGEGFPRLTAY